MNSKTKIRRIALGLIPLVFLGGCGTISEWTRGKDHSDPPAELVEFEQRLVLHQHWQRSVGSGTNKQQLMLVPAVYQGRLIVTDYKGDVTALNATSGEPVWKKSLDLLVSGGPGVGEGLVLIGSAEGELIALAESDGNEVWRSKLSSEILSIPRTAQGKVIVHTIDGRVFCLDALTGKRLWINDRTIPVLTLRGAGSPVIKNDSILIGFATGKLASLNLANGKPRWEVVITPPSGRTELERMVDVDADPVIVDDLVYAATYQGDIASVTFETGVVLWRRELSTHAGLAANWRHLYVTDSQDHVWAMNLQTGAALWQQKDLHARRLTAPALVGDYIVVGDFEGYLHWLSYEDGSLLARTKVGAGPISRAPVYDNEVLYVYGDDGTVAALSPLKPETP